MILLTIGERIRQIRRDKKFMTREELALFLGCDPKTVYAWEHNITTPRIPYFLKLLEAFHISCEDFVKGVDIE